MVAGSSDRFREGRPMEAKPGARLPRLMDTLPAGYPAPPRSARGQALHERVRCPKPPRLPMASVVVNRRRGHGLLDPLHLAKAGVSDAVLLERNRLTSGTTWHSAAQVLALRSSRNLTDLIHHSISLYAGWRRRPAKRPAGSTRARSRSPPPRTSSSISGARRRWRTCSGCAPGPFRPGRQRSAGR